MPSLPPPLRSGDPINSLVPWSVRVIDYLRAITVRPSATVSVSTTANGTILTAAKSATVRRYAAGQDPRLGFLVSIDVDGNVQVETGTAQAWGGVVKVYEAADLGPAVDGYIYAVLDLTVSPPEWRSDLEYGPMTNQNPDEEVWVPIAHIRNLAEQPEEEGEEEPPPVWAVTQLHWGNIVIPAATNVVDIQPHDSP